MTARAGRPEERPDSAQMYEVARLYYKEDQTRQKIAELLHIDPRKVSWLLQQAVALGVVRIDIRETVEGEVRTRLIRKFPHLQRVFIVPGPEIDKHCNDYFRRFGVLAADYFEELLDHHPRGKPFHVGVTGGERILEFANAVPVRLRENVHIHVVALIGRGRLGTADSHLEPSVTASILWTHCGSIPGHCEYETVEPYRGSKAPGPGARADAAAELRRLEKLPSIQSVLREMDELDAVFAGFGYLKHPAASQQIDNSMTMRSLVKSVVKTETLAKEGVIGDFGYCCYDPDGNGSYLSEKDWRFFLTAGHNSKAQGIDFYKKMVVDGKKVIGIGGPYLIEPIRAALKGAIVNVLIIDELTATQLVQGD